MCTYNKMQEQCEILIKKFPDIKIRMAKRYGKRVSNLFSYGVETFTPAEKMELDGNYVIFIQNFEVDSWGKENIKDNMNSIINCRHEE
ncbi:hypothetical protein SH2C18_30490 [Clostridium sediminicola]|uniref:hypothetical protein n=1 Tax=Clostridium sediminicola TaxID=3114879 RepID=UPI0031F2579A